MTRDTGPARKSVRRYESESIELRAGDRIRRARNDRGHGLVNSHMAEVIEVGKESATFRLEDGRGIEMDGNELQLRHLDRAWASTVHAFQGRAVDNVIAVMEAIHPHLTTQKSFCVEISRSRYRAELVTDDGRFVATLGGGFMSARADVVSNLDVREFERTADGLRAAIARNEADMEQEHIELLVNAVYWDDYKDDDFRRLHYLNLWQSLAESKRILGYIGPHGESKLKRDDTIVAGKTSLANLTDCRDDIAHGWTGSIDGNYLADMYRTINELMRRKYF